MSKSASKRAAIVYMNGVEITSHLTYTAWKPGFEYTKNISVKNLNTKSVKFIFNIPKTKFFTTFFPKTITLSPGTTFALPITFRPLEQVNYQDSLELNQLDFNQTLSIRLTAKLPQHKIDLRSNLDLGVACVDEVINQTISVSNTSELDTYFEWDIKEPFSVYPQNGEIKSNCSVDVVLSFQPKGSLIYKGNAVFKYGGNSPNQLPLFKLVEVHGVGKYPHLLVESANVAAKSEATLNFDKVLIGQTVTRHFTLVNMTEVKTDYFIERNDQVPVFDRSFNCFQHMGTLKPFERQKISITYSPNYPSCDVVYDYFTVFSSGRISQNTITCMATNEVPSLSVDTDVLNFGLGHIGQRKMKTFRINNNTQTEIAFQIVTDNDFSAFCFTTTSGTLGPTESKLIQVAFSPQYPIIYYKKVVILVQNHDALAIELIATAHSDVAKPAEISKRHVNLYRFLRSNDLLCNSPEQLAEMVNERKVVIPTDSELTDLQKKQPTMTNEEYIADHCHVDLNVSNRRTTVAGTAAAATNKTSSYVEECIRIDDTYVDFGASRVDNFDEHFNQERSVTITNRTRCKVILYWNSGEHAFSITPSTCEIPAMKSYSFRIKFKPLKPDQFYKCRLEGYALYKSLTDYTATDPKFIIPSWCLNIDCLGHTFHPSSEIYHTPRYQAEYEHLVFPVSLKDVAVYRTFTLSNTSADYPLMFDFCNHSSEYYFVKPLRGMIRRSEKQIFVFKYVPRADAYTVDKCELTLNYMRSHVLELAVVGAGLQPLLTLENAGLLYFAPTCRRNCALQTYEIRNATRAPLRYEWKIPYESRHLFTVDQVTSVLHPYERRKCIWRFAPQKIEKYNHKMSLVAWVDANKDKKDEQQLMQREAQTAALSPAAKVFALRILATCTNGSLQAAEMYKDFGSVIVGSSVSAELVVLNNNDCALDFRLYVRQTVDESATNKALDSLCILELEADHGHVEARSRLSVRCRLRPARLINYQFTIEYQIVYPHDENANEADGATTTPTGVATGATLKENDEQREVLCYMTAAGVYPQLNVIDIKALGAAASLSKDYLWKLLSISELNASMSCEPNPEELIYSIATRQEANRRTANQRSTRQMIEMHFNAAPLHSDDTQIILFMENTGLVPTDWALLFPKDLLLELEYWAQSGDYDIEELEQMKIQDNKLFTIEPKKSHLEPGEAVRITITYRHMFTGQNKLPVLLKIAKGREIMLNLIGTTVAKSEAYVYFPSAKFELEPLEIGLSQYPLQTYVLHNGGDVEAHIEIDASLLDELNQANYARPVLTCMTSEKISVQPGASFETKWRFSPIEAKTYECDVIFKVNHTTFHAVTFKCIGYDKRKMNNALVGSSAQKQDIPEKQIFMLPNQVHNNLASLSVERLVLGDIPLFSRERKLVFVKNNSAVNKISFTWHVTNPDHVRFIRIQPSRGVVAANQSSMCKLTFMSIGRQSFYNVDLICEVKNETEMDVYRLDLDKWKNEQRRQFEEFIIDEHELETRLKGAALSRLNDSPDIVDKTATAAAAAVVDNKKAVSQLAIHRFKTIPPIVKCDALEKSNLDKVRQVREQRKLWKKPVPPTPSLLHLNVIARTQHFDEYMEVARRTRTDCTKFVDPLLGLVDALSPTSVSFSTSSSTDRANHLGAAAVDDTGRVRCSEAESAAVTFILSDLVRSLISDNNFPALVQRIKDEDVPFFVQYATNARDEQNQDIGRKRQQQKETPGATGVAKLIKSSVNSSEQLKTSPMFGALIESILENTISNIVTEAFSKEFSLTSRPRLIALPPKLSSPPGGSNGVATATVAAAAAAVSTAVSVVAAAYRPGQMTAVSGPQTNTNTHTNTLTSPVFSNVSIELA